MLSEKEFFKKQKIYQTSRLKLRQFKVDDADSMYTYTSNPNVAKYCSWPVYQTIEEAQKYIQFILTCYEKQVLAPWAIEIVETGEMIGAIDFVSWSDMHENVEVGYVIAEEHWGKGYVTEAFAVRTIYSPSREFSFTNECKNMLYFLELAQQLALWGGSIIFQS